MIDLFKEIDFSRDIEQNLELKVFIQEACKKVEQEESEHLRKIKKPELDDELLNQFVSTNLFIQSQEYLFSKQKIKKNSLISSKTNFLNQKILVKKMDFFQLSQVWRMELAIKLSILHIKQQRRRKQPLIDLTTLNLTKIILCNAFR